LAPLTLLVGENSTGKTSFQALIRALWDVAFRDAVPYFREEPYDLGGFRDVVYNDERGRQAKSFEADFEYRQALGKTRETDKTSFHVTFTERGAVPFPTTRRVVRAETWFEVDSQESGQTLVRFGTSNNNWEVTGERNVLSRDETQLVPLRISAWEFTRPSKRDMPNGAHEAENSTEYEGLPNQDDLDQLERLVSSLRRPYSLRSAQERPFAGAPVSSRPRRTYDPTRPSRDPEGEYIPTYLSSLYHRNQAGWQRLKRELEKFGHTSGLFDEISIKSLGETEGDPFQVQVRKFGGRGIQRNLIDVGYGVSQALPVLTELLRPDAPSLFLLQQPEVHLHPKAQAALGSLFCSIASQRRQLIVETHSDYIIDRVRMDIRDKKSDLKPEDVSLLFFEPGELEVKIHSLRFDETGNVLDTPEGYRDFFMTEVRRSIGL
jgi:predicted ATPase